MEGKDTYSVLEFIGKRGVELSKLQSQYDCELSDIYHAIEVVKITHVSQSHKLFKYLQEFLLKRRELKNELNLIRSIEAKINGSVKTNLNSKVRVAKESHASLKRILKDLDGKK